MTVSAETVRRWRPELGWEGKRANLVATDEDPQRVEQLARSRSPCEQVRAGRALFVAEEVAMSLLPQVGDQGLPKGEQGAVPTPGTNEQRYLAGALDLTTGTTPPWVW
jgi:hypothetical protein